MQFVWKSKHTRRGRKTLKRKMYEKILAVADIKLERFTSNFMLREQRNRMESPEIDLST